MQHMIDWKQIAADITSATGRSFTADAVSALGGGCINRCFRLGNPRDACFVKINDRSLAPMFEAEHAGLEAISATGTIRVPTPICSGVTTSNAYLVLEFIPLGGGGSLGQRLAGSRLAAMHRCTAEAYGGTHDNFIGSTPQPNRWHDDWIEFWRRQRLGFQLRLAADHGHRGRLQQRGALLLEAFPAFIDHAPRRRSFMEICGVETSPSIPRANR